ncbi:MAG TPA: tRNA (guanosine(37)-N1)-methyltransferase TrmD [Myxococcales bacterium]|nr:tRNA (guanosine(37)-N1)-methyltransferase TrmD [Myxococcales bacterium]
MALKIEILTLFPGMVTAPLSESILGKAQAAGLVEVTVTDIRAFAPGKHHVTDDAPYGGGAGMVMKPEPLVSAIEAARARLPGAPVYLMSPQGRRFDQRAAGELCALASMILVCGRYEGVDERVVEFVDGELSLGDFVLSGGEFAALAVVDAVARLWPGVLGNELSPRLESFEDGLLEHPHYTRPPEFRGRKVPEVLLSGDHAEVDRWRRAQALERTRARRPDLLKLDSASNEGGQS